MPKYDPIFTTVHDQHGEPLHLKATITYDQSSTRYTYNISRWEHGVEFSGKNRQLKIGGKQKKPYHVKKNPDGMIPEHMIHDFIAISMLNAEPEPASVLLTEEIAETAETAPPRELRNSRLKRDFLTYDQGAVRDRSKKNRTVDWKKTADVYVDVIVAAHTELNSARRKISELSEDLSEQGEEMRRRLAESNEQLAGANHRVEELEALVEALRASLKDHLHKYEAIMPKNQLEALGLAQQTFLELLDMIETSPEECLVDAPPLLDPKPHSGSKKGKKRWKAAVPSPLSPGGLAQLPTPDGLDQPHAPAAAAALAPPQPAALNDLPTLGGGETARERAQGLGEALKAQLRGVIRLENAGKMKAAAAAANAIPAGKILGESALCKIAKRVEDDIFKQGSYAMAKAIAKKLTSRPLMKRILDNHVETGADKKARDAIINAARGFLTDIMSARGRRTTVNSNAFWVAATALIPADVLANRQGRATMRLLGVNASTVRRAVELRERAERDKTWEPVVAAKKKCIDPQPLIDWWHREGSVPDNSRKIEVKVEGGEKHPVQYQNGPLNELRQRFRCSSEYEKMNAANRQKLEAIRLKRARHELAQSLGRRDLTVEQLEAKMKELAGEYREKEQTRRVARMEEANGKTDMRLRHHLLRNIPTTEIGDYPDLALSVKYFRRYRCKCIQLRVGTQCDCTKCTYIYYNLARWHRARSHWFREEDCPAADCICKQAGPLFTKVPVCVPCSPDPGAAAASSSSVSSPSKPPPTYLTMTQNAPSLMEFVLCPKEHLRELDIGSAPFLCYRLECCRQRHNNRSSRCGWEAAIGAGCPRDRSTAAFVWKRWESRPRGVDAEGRPVYSLEFVPYEGTRAEFYAEFTKHFLEWLPHIRRHRLGRHNVQRQIESIRAETSNPCVTISFVDFAANLSVPREHTATCAFPEQVRNLVSVTCLNPVEKPDGRKVFRVQPFFGFASQKVKANADFVNKQREDRENILKYGYSIHGEWFCNGQRIPRKDSSGRWKMEVPLPTGNCDDGQAWRITEGESVAAFERATHSVECSDTCGGQFQGKGNAGRIGEWSLCRRISILWEPQHGKSLADLFGGKVKQFLEMHIRDGKFLRDGVREIVLYLAQHHPRPTSESSPESIYETECYNYGYYSDDLFSRQPVEYLPRRGATAREFHFRAAAEVTDTRTSNIPLIVRQQPCGCDSCKIPICNFRECLLRDGGREVVGGPVGAYLERKVPLDARVRKERLAEFIKTVKCGQIRAIAVAEDQWGLEGPFWLAKATSDPFQLTERTIQGAETFDKGWSVVKGKYFGLRTQPGGNDAGDEAAVAAERVYELLDQELLFNINAMFRIAPLCLNQKVGAESLVTLPVDEQRRIEEVADSPE